MLPVLIALPPQPLPAAQVLRQYLGGRPMGTLSTGAGEAEGRGWHQVDEQVELPVGDGQARLATRVRVERAPGGSLRITWRVELGGAPQQGEAHWSPEAPDHLDLMEGTRVLRRLPVPAGALLWPPDAEARLREAARRSQPLSITTFQPTLGLWQTQRFTPEGLSPLPGCPDALRFQVDVDQEGRPSRHLAWISPSRGLVRQEGRLMDQPHLLLGEGLQAPAPPKAMAGPALNPHPLAAWGHELHLAPGPTDARFPEDDQQVRLPGGGLRLREALPPAPGSDLRPLRPPFPARPDLAPSALVDHGHPRISGLLVRLSPSTAADRWALARAVTRFVFDLFPDKALDGRFASASEAARADRGDCTEHTVLALALLRRLGVPARAVSGWVASGDTFAPHLWVEVEAGARWIPVDPTFGEAPASALRVKVATTDLTDLAALSWETPDLRPGPLDPADRPRIEGSTVQGPGLPALHLSDGAWTLEGPWLRAHLLTRTWRVRACPHPPAGHRSRLTALAGPAGRAYCPPVPGTGYLQLDDRHWLEVQDLDVDGALLLLGHLSL